MDLTRKDFLKLSVAFLSTAAFGCGSETSSSVDLISSGSTDMAKGGAGNCLQNGTSSSISANHGHSITVPIFDITTGTDKTYDIAGTGGHSHSVTLTAADFTALGGNNAVTKTSTSSNGHSHMVTITCA